MAKLSMMLMVVVVVLGFSMVGFASTPMNSSSGSGQQTAAMGHHSYGIIHHSYRGRVMSYDKTDNTLAVNGKRGEKTFDVSKAKISGTVQPNDAVVVKYRNLNGQMVASSVKEVRAKVSQKAQIANPNMYAANDNYPYAYPYTYQPGYGSKQSGTCAITGCGIGGTPATLGEKGVA